MVKSVLNLVLNSIKRFYEFWLGIWNKEALIFELILIAISSISLITGIVSTNIFPDKTWLHNIALLLFITTSALVIYSVMIKIIYKTEETLSEFVKKRPHLRQRFYSQITFSEFQYAFLPDSDTPFRDDNRAVTIQNYVDYYKNEDVFSHSKLLLAQTLAKSSNTQFISDVIKPILPIFAIEPSVDFITNYLESINIIDINPNLRPFITLIIVIFVPFSLLINYRNKTELQKHKQYIDIALKQKDYEAKQK